MRAEGQLGELRRGVRVAARIVHWQLTEVPVLGTVYEIRFRRAWTDPFWITQGPFQLRLCFGASWLVWDSVEVAQGDTITVRQGPQVQEVER